jgi:2-dehydropantoate 2-reductase
VSIRRFIIYGAGAIGGVIGGNLAGAGHEVGLIARGRHLEAIRSDGLRLETGDGTRSYQLPAYGSPAEVDWRPGDVVVLTMKGTDTEPALRELGDVADPATAVFCAQNGVANELAALRRFEHTYGVCVMLPAAHLEPGVVQQNSLPVPGILDLGRYPDGVDDTAEQVAAALRSAGFHSEPRPDIMRWKYRKLLMNLGNAFNALSGRGDEVNAAAERAREEAEAVLKAAGITPVSEAEDKERRDGILQIRPVGGRRRSGGSSWQSLARSTGSIETDYLSGEIVLLGRLYGVPTPVNAYAQRTANRFARERQPPGSLPPQELLAELDAAVLSGA